MLDDILLALAKTHLFPNRFSTPHYTSILQYKSIGEQWGACSRQGSNLRHLKKRGCPLSTKKVTQP